MKQAKWVAYVAPAVFALIPLALHNEYYLKIIMLALIWVVIGSSWNLLAGFTGQVSFGHAVFFGTGAYAGGLIQLHFDASPWWGLATAGPAAMLVGLFLGWVCFRLRGPYFALATIAMGELFRLLALYFKDFTAGTIGITVKQDFRYDNIRIYYYLILAVAVACVFTIRHVMRSKWGYYFVAIREDQDAAESMGISNFRYKSLSLMISSFFTGLAGVFYLLLYGYIDPEVVYSLHYISIMAILVGIIGGVGTIWGPAVGAFIMVGVQETFRSGFFGLAEKFFGAGFSNMLKTAHAFVFGLLVILVILFLANGVVGDWRKIWPWAGKPKTAQTGGQQA